MPIKLRKVFLSLWERNSLPSHSNVLVMSNKGGIYDNVTHVALWASLVDPEFQV